MLSFLKGIGAAWQILRWLLAEKKKMEADAESYFTEERAKAWRLEAEKLFYQLSKGNGNLKKMPKFIQWIFGNTTVDDRIGWFGLHLLKSEKLATNDKVLEEPVKPYPCH
jgi:hypothetical protein